MLDECNRERQIRKVLSGLARQRVAMILQPQDGWVIERALQRDEDTEAALGQATTAELEMSADRALQQVAELAEQQARPTEPLKIHRPPGFALLSVAEILFSRRIRAEVLEPTIRDLQQEHLEALAAGRLSQARWIVYRGYWSFWSTVVAQIPVSLLRKVYDIWKATGGGS